MRSRVAFAAVAAATLALDQLSKSLVHAHLAAGEVVVLIGGYLRMIYVTNTGAVFGILSATPSPFKEALLLVIAALALGIMVYYFFRYPLERHLFHVGLGMVFGGAAGNIVDRLLRGYVIDFIDFHIKNRFSWPTFNVADCAICVGIALMILDMRAGRAGQREKTSDVS